MDSWGWELTCEDAWSTSEGNLVGLLEHVWLSMLLGLFEERRRTRYTVPVSQKEYANQWFRIWSGFCLCWSAEQVTEITQKSIDPEFLPTATNVERGVPNLEFVLQRMYTAFMVLTRYEANDSAANPRKKPLEAWRKLQTRCDPTTGGKSEICFARSFHLESALCWNSEQGLNDGNHTCSATRKRCRTQQTMSSSSCWSGGTGPEELEKHLILNSNRWRTFDNAHLEIVTFVEAKLGLRIRDSKPSQTGARGHADPKDVDALNSLASGTGKRKGSSSPRHGCVQCGGAHVQRDCHVHVTPRKGNGKKGSRANHGPRVLTKERARKIWEIDNPKGRSTGSKSAKSSDKGKMSNTGSSGL